MKPNGAITEPLNVEQFVLSRRLMRNTMKYRPSKKGRGFQRSFQIKVLDRKSQKYGKEVCCREKKRSS